MNLKECQTLSDTIQRIDAITLRVEMRIRQAGTIMNQNMMPYLKKVQADAKLNEGKMLLEEIREENKPILELLKKEREGQQ